LRRLANAAAWLVIVPAMVNGETRVALREIVVQSPDVEVAVQQFRSLLEGDLVRLAVEAAERGDCSISVVDIGRTVTDARAVEKDLAERGHTSAETAPTIQPVSLDLAIDGVAGVSYGEVDYVLQVSDPDTGKLVGEIQGSVPQEGVSEHTARIAQELLSRICPKAWHLTARYNDLSLDDIVCDISKPFAVHGKGETAGIVFSFSPTGDKGGSFAVGGTAGGVPWSGGGSYSVAIAGESGTMPIVGSWKISTPVGVFGDSGTIPGKLAAAKSCAAGKGAKTAQGAAPAGKSKARAKGK
jgi:hypothetical protein